jgi:hypothetical protein
LPANKKDTTVAGSKDKMKHLTKRCKLCAANKIKRTKNSEGRISVQWHST